MEMVTLDNRGIERSRKTCGHWLLLPEEADDAVNDIARSCQHTGDFWGTVEQIAGSYRPIPWALIALDRDYALVGHLMQMKGTTRDLRFTWYSSIRREPTHLSFLFAMNKTILAQLAARTPLIGHVWNILKDKAENRRWFCLCDPLPDEWARKHESMDTDLRHELQADGLIPQPQN
jgi:hypothetical protein